MATVKTNTSINKAKVSLSQAIDAISISHLVERSEKVRLPIYLVGPPGQGKSAIVDQYCLILNEAGKKKFLDELSELGQKEFFELPRVEQEIRYRASGHAWEVLHLRLSQCDPTDLKGVPVFTQTKSLDGKEVDACTFAPPRTLPLVGVPESADGMNVILFLDELPQANPTIQNLASNIIDGKVGDYSIDLDRSLIIIAGNRKEDKAAVFDTPRNVANRVCELHVNTTFTEWEPWAVENKLNPYVIGFLKNNTVIFNEPVPEQPGPYGTPRSWHKAGALINAQGELFFQNNNSIALQMLIGLVGQSSAMNFHTWVRAARSKYSVDKILTQPDKVSYPTETERDTLFGIVLELTYRINQMIEPIVAEPDYIKADGQTKDRIMIEKLGKTGVASINNAYSWVYEGGKSKRIDAGFAVLLNKYQSKNILQSGFRGTILSAKEFSTANTAYMYLMDLMNRKN